MVTGFSVEANFLTGESKQEPVVREVDEIWINESEMIGASDGRRLVFVERYLGDRVEAWVSVMSLGDDGVTVEESARWNASRLMSISFKQPR